MKNGDEQTEDARSEAKKGELPLPSMHFRRRAWKEFQKALDPLAPPKRLPLKKLH